MGLGDEIGVAAGCRGGQHVRDDRQPPRRTAGYPHRVLQCEFRDGNRVRVTRGVGQSHGPLRCPDRLGIRRVGRPVPHLARLAGGHLRPQRQRAVAGGQPRGRGAEHLQDLDARRAEPVSQRVQTQRGVREHARHPRSDRRGRRPRGSAARPSPASAGSVLRGGQFEEQPTPFVVDLGGVDVEQPQRAAGRRRRRRRVRAALSPPGRPGPSSRWPAVGPPVRRPADATLSGPSLPDRACKARPTAKLSSALAGLGSGRAGSFRGTGRGRIAARRGYRRPPRPAGPHPTDRAPRPRR